MRKLASVCLAAMLLSCSLPVRFVKTDADYVPKARPPGSGVVFRQGRIERPHRVVGVIAAELGRNARRPELDALLVSKALEVGADGVMLVEYDVDRDVYIDIHHAVVGHGPWRRHVVGRHRRVEVNRTATGIAVVFD